MGLGGKGLHALFRRKSRNHRATQPEIDVERPKPLEEMSPEEVDQEIKVRFKALQQLGKIPGGDSSIVVDNKAEPIVIRMPVHKPKQQKFQPKIFAKRNIIR